MGKDWKPSDTDPNSGTGHFGICCNEMDIWESNKQDTAYTPHVCTPDGYTPCEGDDCGDNGPTRYKGFCDKDGCDLNAYRAGVKPFNSLTDETCAAQKKAMGDVNDFAKHGGGV